ncbi:SDR family NAD(P)-dependent oxidoreductase [Nonomuraea sp. M3C6]|uniref:SDR family NAD(P)-dependent oxidoreductase n=1 Tax=Nonomuraea marmarensis TaxID=3351344 RepID=A0ABW7ALE7_9ACTN
MDSIEQENPPPARTRSGRDLDGEVVIITGSAQGIGRTFARAFAESGSRVVVADRDTVGAEAVAAELRKDGHDATAVTVDVADERSVEELLRLTLEHYGRVDTLVNNAAIFSTIVMKPFDAITAAEWRQVIDVNLTGVFLCCRTVGGHLRAQGHGSIINVSSAAVLQGRPNYLHYVASKAGVVGLTRSLARELGAAQVTVNALMPGSVDTGIPRDSVSPGQAEQIIAGQAVHRRLRPADIAGAAVFLASEAARTITGQSIVIDGGMNFL